MQKSTLARTLVAGGVAGLGLTVGGIALAPADDDAGVLGGHRGPGGHGGMHGDGPSENRARR